MRHGSETPRIFTPPLRELTPETSLGFAVIAFAVEVLGIVLLPWERWLFVHALELREDGSFRFRTVVVLVARQNGKSVMSMVLSLFFLYVLGVDLVIGTAQSLDQAEEVWDGVVEMAEEHDDLREEIEHVLRVNGKKTLKLTGNRKYRIKAATRKTRGPSADLILLDELREHQSWDAWGAVTKTTLARINALVWCMSNAGDPTSVVLRHLRLLAHRALGDPDGICKALDSLGDPDDGVDIPDDDSLGLFEWSAAPGRAVSDRDGWSESNPSLGYGFLTERALASACATDPADVFRTECLCQWVETVATPPFPVGSWEAGKDDDSCIAPDAKVLYGVDVSADRAHASIAVAGMRADHAWHIEVVAYRSGLGWLRDWFAERASTAPMTVALQSRGAPVSGMVDVLESVSGVEVIKAFGRDLGSWSGRLWDSVAACDDPEKATTPKVFHRPQPALDLAAQIAVTRPLGDGAWGWDRNKSTEDISPLVACTMAFGAATYVPPEDAKTSAYDDGHDLIFL